jgi:hypothetical protein
VTISRSRWKTAGSWKKSMILWRSILRSTLRVGFIYLDNEAAEIDKKTVLDLCAHMFHSREQNDENSENS